MRQSPTHEAIHDKKTARHRLPGSPLRFPTLSGLRQWPSHSAVGRMNFAVLRDPAALVKSMRARRGGALAGAALTLLALAAAAGAPAATAGAESGEQAVAYTLRDGEGERASRSHDRMAAPAADGLVSIDPKLRAEAEAAAAAEEARRQAEAQAAAAEEARKQAEAQAAAAAAAAAAQPVPVGGLSQTQMNNAKQIVVAAQEMGLPKRAMVIAIATALQESRLHNLASTRIPESYSYTQEGEGSDHDSVGLFQQRPSAGWGSVAECMNPNYSTKAFLNGLLRVPGWDSMPLTYAAQAVQVSAFPEAYAKHEGLAQLVADTIAP